MYDNILHEKPGTGNSLLFRVTPNELKCKQHKFLKLIGISIHTWLTTLDIRTNLLVEHKNRYRTKSVTVDRFQNGCRFLVRILDLSKIGGHFRGHQIVGVH